VPDGKAIISAEKISNISMLLVVMGGLFVFGCVNNFAFMQNIIN
jgi:hypothetical protein